MPALSGLLTLLSIVVDVAVKTGEGKLLILTYGNYAKSGHQC